MNKHKHLDFIQSVISRLNANSFLIKGWCITVISALFVLSQKDSNFIFIKFSIIPCISFWIIDGYYISTERKYKSLYKHVIKLDESEIDFSMDTKTYEKCNNLWLRCIFSKTLIPFYGIMISSLIVFYYSL